MESNLEVALASKLSRLFPPADDTFLAFPLSGAAFSAEDLDIFETKGESAEGLRTRLHRKAQFARILNQIPQDSIIYKPTDRMLWAEYEQVLDRAQMASSVLTPRERKRLSKAKDFLTDQLKVHGVSTTVYSAPLKAYYRYKEAYEQIELTLLDEKITAEASTNQAAKWVWTKKRKPQLTALRDKAMQDWLTLGHKDQVESAQAVVDSLSGKNPEVRRLELRAEFDECVEPDLVANDPKGAFSTFYSPSDSFAAKVQWQELHLTRAEFQDLLDSAPAELQGWRSDNAAHIESVTVQYANVVIIRPWFDPSFFETRSWRMPDKKGAAISDGKLPRTGRIPAFITNMIVARKITIGRTEGAQPKAQLNLQKLDLIKRYNQALDVKVALRGRSPVRPLAVSLMRQPTLDDEVVGRIRRRDDLLETTDPMDATETPVRDAQMDGVTVTRPPVFIPPPPPPPVADQPGDAPPVVTEELELDGVVVLAYRCRRIPKSPDPDKSLDWTRRSPVLAFDEQSPAPVFPLPKGHWFGSATKAPRSHAGDDANADRIGVRRLQRRLKELGHDLVVDGRYQRGTAETVRAFQRSAALDTNGRVDAPTWKALWQTPTG